MVVFDGVSNFTRQFRRDRGRLLVGFTLIQRVLYCFVFHSYGYVVKVCTVPVIRRSAQGDVGRGRSHGRRERVAVSSPTPLTRYDAFVLQFRGG